mmetsp:Transcript_23640/g.44980  ORF Transcript_23640/g.44980 Transcript_23640/m.44980 type:complete len:431 (-) Transcript_23640:336-1628(-)
MAFLGAFSHGRQRQALLGVLGAALFGIILLKTAPETPNTIKTPGILNATTTTLHGPSNTSNTTTTTVHGPSNASTHVSSHAPSHKPSHAPSHVTSHVISHAPYLASLPAVPLPRLGHWKSQWDFGSGVVVSGQEDTRDPRATQRGPRKHSRIYLTEGIMKMYGNSRYYIDNTAIGWRNVEMTGYAKWANDGTPSSLSGFTMVARSNHDVYDEDGCQAAGYYAKIYRSNGECSFQKEYYHDVSNNKVYSTTKRVDCLTKDDFVLGRTIGIKFTVTTLRNNTQHANGTTVELRLFLDRDGDGSWNMVHEYIDEPGQWTAAGNLTIPEACPQRDGDTIVRPGNSCLFRSDGALDTEVHWTNASIANHFGYCTPSDAPCLEHLDCCSGKCSSNIKEAGEEASPAGVCVGDALLPPHTGQMRRSRNLRDHAPPIP